MQINEIKPNSLYSAHEVVTLNIASKDTLARWRSDGREIPFIKCGANVRYLGQDILDWLNSNRKTAV
jgi:hypothetical protein